MHGSSCRLRPLLLLVPLVGVVFLCHPHTSSAVSNLYDDDAPGHYYEGEEGHNSSYAYLDEQNDGQAGMRGSSHGAYAEEEAGYSESSHSSYGSRRGGGRDGPGAPGEYHQAGEWDGEDGADGDSRSDVHPLYEWDNCNYADEGRYTINGTLACDLQLSGADAHADLLVGGLDGLYSLTGCFDGKPTYVRRDGPPGEERALSYNDHFGDWEFNIGSEPSEDQLVLYSDFGYVSPLDVARWHLAVAFSTAESGHLVDQDEDVFYIAAGITVVCSDASQRDTSARRGAPVSDVAPALSEDELIEHDTRASGHAEL